MTKSNIIQKLLLYITGASIILATGCNKSLHESDIIPTDESKSAVTITLNNAEIEDKVLTDAHLYFFDASEMLSHHTYYPTMQSLALERLLMESGYYTIFAVLNTEESLVPVKTRADLPQISFSEFCQWVKKIDDGTYPDLATGLVRHEVKEGISQINIDIKNGSGAVEISKVKFNLTFPQPLLPDYIVSKALKAGENVQLRAVIEVFEKGTDTKIIRHTKFVEPTAKEGVYFTEIAMPQGEFDIRIWGDYAENEMADYHYNTSNLKDVQILPKESYHANTDTRDGFAFATSIVVGAKDQSENYTLHRPLAKYKIVANDIEKYNEIRSKRGYPPLEELKIYVMYSGFFPAGYNIVDKTLTASREGYKYAAGATESNAQKATVAKDFVLVNGKESGVIVNIIFKDAQDNTISGVNGIKVNYKAGYLTTISGDFLTAGKGGVDIDTSWEDNEFDVEF